MILRKEEWIPLIALYCVLIDNAQSQNAKTYDTSEWIPIAPSTLQQSPSEVAEDKVANDRVLSLDVPAQRFFPNEEYDYRKRLPNQVQPYISQSPKGVEQPRPRKLKHPSDYKFETPPPPPSKNQPEINYYNGENVSPYMFEQPYVRPVKQQQNYYIPLKKSNSPVEVPSVNPQAPAPDAPSLYEQYQLPFNASFYQSLNPSSINNDFYQAISNKTISNRPPKTNVEQESVQLVYVPVENLKPKQEVAQHIHHKQIKFPPQGQLSQDKHIYDLPQTPQFIYNPPRQEKLISVPVTNKQTRLESIQQDFIQQALQASKLQQQFRDAINPIHQEIITTTPKPKPKPHQPPLAVFLESQKKAEISDVLNILRGAKTISVQDTVTPNSPRIFIGPSNLDSPDGYTKFPLPYLNNINGNRIERKIDQLPFFVAPVNYKAPTGYAKISLPSPHVGSVVVSVPTPTTTEIPPVSLSQNPFEYRAPGYDAIEPVQVSRPQEDFVNNYNIIDSSRGRYQSTVAPPVTEEPLIPPTRDIFDLNSYRSRLPEEYYNNDFPTLNVYSPQQVQEQPALYKVSTTTTTTTTSKPKENVQLPDVNPLELAINEFELHQINDKYEVEHNKVKHSTRRPSSSHTDNESSNTRTPNRGRYTYDEEPTTERFRGRTRTRGRGGSTRMSSTTTSTTTAPPKDTDRYTVLEEFNARNPSTESYRSPSAEAQTETTPRRLTTQFSANPYLPEYAGPQQQFIDSSQAQFERPKEKPQVSTQRSNEDFPITSPPTDTNFYSSRTEIEQIPANIYSFSQPQTYERPPTGYRDENIQPHKNQQTKNVAAEDVTPAQAHRFRPELVSYENREPNQRRPAYQPYDEKELKSKDETIHQSYQGVEVKPNQSIIQERPIQQQQYERPEFSIQGQPTYQQQYEEIEVKGPVFEPNAETKKVDQKPVDDPSGFLDNLFRPNFDQTYISLQDQAVRSLLVPLAPGSKEKSATSSDIVNVEKQFSPTESIVEEPSTEATTTTTSTTRPTRGRGRGRARVSTTPSSYHDNTSARRTSGSRRRPASRTTTEKIQQKNDYSTREDSGRSETKQRVKTKGRPNHNEITDRISTTDGHAVAEPGFVGITGREPSQSYMQFEHALDEQQIITINPNNRGENIEYQVYESLPIQTTTEPQQPIVLEYDNTRMQQITPVVDVQIAHVVPEEVPRTTTEEYLRYSNNANIKSGGVLNNNQPEEQSSRVPTTKTRGRTRGRSRFVTTTSSSPPVTRLSPKPSSAPQRSTTQKDEQEFYGFTRQPNYIPANLNIQAQSYRNDEPVSETRSSHVPRTNTPQQSEDLETIETPRPRIRSRTRAPSRKTANNNYRQAENEIHSARSTEQVTRRSGVPTRTRGRGSTQYKVPENVKRESDDEDVANQNYPVHFLQKLDASSTKSNEFQIASEDETLYDQQPHSSIYRPKFLPKPNESTEPNALLSEDKVVSTEEPKASALVHTTENNMQLISEVDKVIADLEKIQTEPTEQTPTTLQPTEETIKENKNKRRGVWKLVKQRPVDPLEVSESQNYETVLNAFSSIRKVDAYGKSGYKNKENPVMMFQDEINYSKDVGEDVTETIVVTTTEDEDLTTTSPTVTQENFFGTLYEMFGLFKKSNNTETVTTVANPATREEITEQVATTTNDDTIETTTAVSSTSTAKSLSKPYEIEPWEMRAVKTSTSTEVSHETEICYRGRCVKSKEKKKAK